MDGFWRFFCDSSGFKVIKWTLSSLKVFSTKSYIVELLSNFVVSFWSDS